MKTLAWFLWSCVLCLSFLGAPVLRSQSRVAGVLEVGDRPVAVAINPATNQAFVAVCGTQEIAVVDLTSRTLTGRYRIGGIPEAVAVNPATNLVVAVSVHGLVALIDHAQGRIVANLPAGKSPSRVAIDPQSNSALVTNFNGSNMVVIDLAARKVVKTISLKNGPLGIGVLPGTRRAVVACQYDMEILQVDLAAGAPDRERIVGRYLSDLAVHPTTGQVVVGNPTSNGVLAVYDPAANSVSATLPVGAGPLTPAIYPARDVVVVTEYNSGTLSVVDMKLTRVVRTVEVGKGPLGVAVHPESGLAVVAQKLSNTVAFVDLNTLLREVSSR